MNPQFQKLQLVSDYSFSYNKLCCKYFGKLGHFHEEIELVLIEQIRRTKFIGDIPGEHFPNM